MATLVTWVRTHRLAAAALAAVLVIGVPVLVWFRIASSTASEVSVSWSPDCGGPGGVTTFQGHTALTFRNQSFCTLKIDIANGGSRAVHVTGIEAPFLGSEAGDEMVGRSLPGARVRDLDPDDTDGSLDAIYDVDLVVAPNSDKTVEIKIGWRSDGCSGATSTFEHWPAVRFETAHWHFTRAAAQDLILSFNPTGKPAPGCQRPS